MDVMIVMVPPGDGPLAAEGGTRLTIAAEERKTQLIISARSTHWLTVKVLNPRNESSLDFRSPQRGIGADEYASKFPHFLYKSNHIANDVPGLMRFGKKSVVPSEQLEVLDGSLMA
uniref:Uncharacterized protein n=1 Tax=Trichuris muris TaxID=70415 RepID=A0A5S6QME8_TRIMR